MRHVLLAWLFCIATAVGTIGGRVPPGKTPKGFVTTKGPAFNLDGKPFYFVGANSYWLPLLTEQRDIDATFKEMKAAGIKVLRTWGFNAINATELPYAKENDLTYYQVWDKGGWKLNDGPQGLKRLDNVIETAGKYGIKVLLAFTNNWIGYGGSELYVNWIAGSGALHDSFYSDKRIVASYQKYVKTIVDRYKHSENIFAWELMNEARCRGDLQGGPGCVAGTDLISHWYKDQAAFVRKLDPHHLITTGGEGHFYKRNEDIGYWYNGQWVSDYNYNGQAGEDFDLDLTLDDIDFGTYHIYPQYWYGSTLDTPNNENFTIGNWGLSWIQDHADSAKKANKPVILEEFGVSGIQNKTEIYPRWVKHALDTNHGILPWQFGMLGLKENGGNKLFKYEDRLVDGASPNDGFAIYKNQTEIWNIFTDAAKVQNAKSK
ncbi:glycoside hydrolase superfamily [Ephemerocybe angulata]|uniref:mannan endo-1,4-beta-mannosidase n=1 Tax=Ephemerocybe angulata TaxID=980116 RepID=A0A8H6IK10_9AGAR|nr:glycoside hydrolase superfamily [Tulosesus angulatus]